MSKLVCPLINDSFLSFIRRMKSSQYKAGVHLSEVTSEERRLILNSSGNEEMMTGVAFKTK